MIERRGSTPMVRHRVNRPPPLCGRRRAAPRSPQAWYEDAIGLLLSEVGSVDDVTITEVVRRYHDRPTRVDDAALARIAENAKKPRGACQSRAT